MFTSAAVLQMQPRSALPRDSWASCYFCWHCCYYYYCYY